IFSCIIRCIFVSFFFQAEDGIRDFHVTGVQTCALPILFAQREKWPLTAEGLFHELKQRSDAALKETFFLTRAFEKVATLFQRERSEERRVGKECRSR